MNIFHAAGYCYSRRFLSRVCASDTLHTAVELLQFNLVLIISLASPVTSGTLAGVKCEVIAALYGHWYIVLHGAKGLDF